MPISPHAQPPAPSMHVGTASRRGERIGRRQGRALAALLMAAGATIGATGCAQATTTSAGSPSIAASDLERIASGNKSPGSSSSAASSFATSGTSGSGQFVVPEAAKAHTKEGAVAFVKFYWNMLGQLDQHPQTGVIPKFAASDCKSCTRQEQHTADLVKEQGQSLVHNLKRSQGTVRPDSTLDSVVVQTSYSDTGTTHVVAGRAKESFPTMRSRTDTRVDWVKGGWIVGEIGSDIDY